MLNCFRHGSQKEHESASSPWLACFLACFLACWLAHTDKKKSHKKRKIPTICHPAKMDWGSLRLPFSSNNFVPHVTFGGGDSWRSPSTAPRLVSRVAHSLYSRHFSYHVSMATTRAWSSVRLRVLGCPAIPRTRPPDHSSCCCLAILDSHHSLDFVTPFSCGYETPCVHSLPWTYTGDFHCP